MSRTGTSRPKALSVPLVNHRIPLCPHPQSLGPPKPFHSFQRTIYYYWESEHTTTHLYRSHDHTLLLPASGSDRTAAAAYRMVRTPCEGCGWRFSTTPSRGRGKGGRFACMDDIKYSLPRSPCIFKVFDFCQPLRSEGADSNECPSALVPMHGTSWSATSAL